MRLQILGTRGEVPESAPKHSKHSGILVDKKLLLDLGEQEFLQYQPKWILITHLHPDHAYIERVNNKNRNGITVPIYAPEKSTRQELQVFEPNTVKRLGAYKITSIPTHHSIRVKSQGYLIEQSDKKILYTGDLVWIDKKYQKSFNHLNLVITDGSFIRKGGMIRRNKQTGAIYGHNGIEELIKLFKPYTRKILFVHFGSWFYQKTEKRKQMLQALGKKHDIDITSGYDGMSLII